MVANESLHPLGDEQFVPVLPGVKRPGDLGWVHGGTLATSGVFG
jgi:hypothetical protein